MRKYESKEQNGLNNKGFSLVELIIVVAIMAVLIAVLAPQYLRYVERTRLQRDNSAISEVANSMKIACAEERVINYIAGETGQAVSYTFTAGGGPSTSTTALGITFTAGTTDILADELALTLNGCELQSTTYASQATDATIGAVVITVTIDPATNIPTVTADHYTTNDQTNITQTF